MTGPSNLSGFWTGRYLYMGSAPSVTFIATLNDRNGSLSGQISEPNRIGESSNELHAFLRGMHDREIISFLKTYDGASDAAHSVQYHGIVSPDGCLISGVWRLPNGSGSFEMQREILDEDEEEEALAAEVDDSARF